MHSATPMQSSLSKAAPLLDTVEKYLMKTDVQVYLRLPICEWQVYLRLPIFSNRSRTLNCYSSSPV